MAVLLTEDQADPSYRLRPAFFITSSDLATIGPRQSQIYVPLHVKQVTKYKDYLMRTGVNLMITVEAMAYMVAEGLAQEFSRLEGHNLSTKKGAASFQPEE